jgi:ATP-dependent RNA helicase RhlE
MTFESLGLSEALVQAVHEKGYDTPTSIQQQAIPAILRGVDLMAAAQTGTGKTAGFTLPILQLLMQKPEPISNRAYVLILTPTRELAAQVHDSVVAYGKHLNLRSAVVFGGVKINPQMMQLRAGVDVLVATPGRLMDLYQQNAIRFDEVGILVLDEADRMLDMGFIRDIKKIISLLPKRRQNLLFSATFSPEIRQLAKGLLTNPLEIDIAPRNTPHELVVQKMHPVDKASKVRLLSHLIQAGNWYQVLVFSRTKHGADRLVRQLSQDGIRTTAIHGNKSQPQRTQALADFKKGKVQVLVATDIAARGIDIDQLPHVINFDLPDIAEDYVHRIGRTGRAGATGEAISLVSADEFKQLRDIEKLIKREIPREEVEGFAPRLAVPASGSIAGAASNKRGVTAHRGLGSSRPSADGGAKRWGR